MSASTVLSRLSARVPSLSLKLHKKAISPKVSPFKLSSESQVSVSERRISGISRLPLELGSMMPLHSAIASARLKSILSMESQSWGMIPQGDAFSQMCLISCFDKVVNMVRLQTPSWKGD
ncbi:hypothetical protein HHK36_021628 [Tetracentron sinense]|uniref:Uncharacterized protein n=1 Tax=Tetracentron sinense TaxID=13715 RepID=A0A834YTF6_TETSI|nr:hypothetical protein HHK36_021628 [Tetracentron sinense]